MEKIVSDGQNFGNTSVYECPKVEMIEVKVESGFCLSGEFNTNNEKYTPVIGTWD